MIHYVIFVRECELGRDGTSRRLKAARFLLPTDSFHPSSDGMGMSYKPSSRNLSDDAGQLTQFKLQQTTYPWRTQPAKQSSTFWSRLSSTFRSSAPAPKKPLAHYPHYDNKWSVAGPRLAPSLGRAYPYREYVGGKRVLASYPHHRSY